MINQIASHTSQSSIAEIAATKSTEISHDSEAVENYLNSIDQALTDGVQLPSRTAASSDMRFMEELVELANNKASGLNASLMNSPRDLANKVKELIEQKQTSARFIVNMGDGGIHFAAFDYSLRDGKPSVVGVEPATTNGMGPALLVFRCQAAFSEILQNVPTVIIESDLQRSNGECGMFSLSLAKKMFQEQLSFAQIHDKNTQGILGDSYGIVTANESNNLLPPTLMKHAQSEKRLQAYLAAQPEAREVKVNKRGETLEERQARHIVEQDHNGKSIKYSNSIEVKRQVEITTLLNSKA
ncbi:YopJ/AvrA family T3SS effector serine/threonine acetyltransferase [Chitinimonas sp. PSY-7]|uniref:YopJ/AvrA family T3SS effector serine/threonine acetyltransferase n=1 Tax=Chitinimonas sp. PSY-7 TaxID=3459088 RepID=UPI00403FE91B